MDEYQGQPDYVVAGFLAELFEAWNVVLPNDEWGEYVEALMTLARRAVTPDEARSITVSEWALEELKCAHDEDWWGVADEKEEQGFEKARLATEEVIDYWRDRAVSFKGEIALEERVAWLRARHKWLWPKGTAEDLALRDARRKLDDAQRAVERAQARVAQLTKNTDNGT